MIKNDEGLVALEHYNSNPKTVKIDADGTTYNFKPQHNVSLAWVQEKHVNQLLDTQVDICCGKRRMLCHLASETNVNLWRTGNRYGETGD